MFCSNCGHEISEDAKVCDNCGEYVLPLPQENNESAAEDGQAVFNNEELLIINKHNKPLSTLSFLAMQVMLLIPVVNVVLLLVWSFRKDTNANRRAFARSALVWFIVFCVVLLFVLLTFIFMGYPVSINAFVRLLKEVVNRIPE